jgi:hypothetical protein
MKHSAAGTATKDDGRWKVEDGKKLILHTHKKSSKKCAMLG